MLLINENIITLKYAIYLKLMEGSLDVYFINSDKKHTIEFLDSFETIHNKISEEIVCNNLTYIVSDNYFINTYYISLSRRKNETTINIVFSNNKFIIVTFPTKDMILKTLTNIVNCKRKNRIVDEIIELKTMIEYMPGNSGYQIAKTDFEEKISN